MKKRQYITDAFALCGLGLEFDLEPEQLEFALGQLDGMVGTWDAKGINIGWPFGESSDLDQETGASNQHRQAITTNLALLIAPAFGKVVAPQTQIAAKQAYDALLIQAAQPGQMQYPGGFPLGAGHYNRLRRYTSQPDVQIRSNTQEIDT
jgi:hypothetical protein